MENRLRGTHHTCFPHLEIWSPTRKQLNICLFACIYTY